VWWLSKQCGKYRSSEKTLETWVRGTAMWWACNRQMGRRNTEKENSGAYRIQAELKTAGQALFMKPHLTLLPPPVRLQTSSAK